MKGPPITVSCDCGQRRDVPYGETWTCEDCHRRWNTAQVPVQEYSGIMTTMRKERIKVMVVALGTGALFLILTVFVSGAFLLLVPVALSGWYLGYMPLWRKRLRRQVRDLPTWDLTPE